MHTIRNFFRSFNWGHIFNWFLVGLIVGAGAMCGVTLAYWAIYWAMELPK